MTIYVEQSLLENFVIDFLLLKLSLLIFKYKTKKRKIFLASFLGALASLISPLISSYLSVLFKLVLSLIMVLIICPKLDIKKTFYLYLSFISFTFLFGGASYFLKTTVSTFYNNQINNIPFFYILLLCVLIFYTTILIVQKIYTKKSFVNFEFNVTLFSEHTKISTTAFLDSGNKLTDNFMPVILIDSLTFLKLYPTESLTNVLLKKTDKLSMQNTHILKISNINNSYSNLVVFTLPKLIIEKDKEFCNIPCAITLKKFNLNEEASCLLNPLLF